MKNADVDTSGIRIDTFRLTLRPFEEKDLNDFYEYAKVPGVGEGAGWLPHQTKDETKKVLMSFIAGKKTLAIVHKDDKKVIGSIGLEPFPGDIAGYPSNWVGREVGFALSTAYWGHGLMTEAMTSLIPACFSILGLDFISLGHWVGDNRAARVAEKCGFKHVEQRYFKTSFGDERLCDYYLLLNPRLGCTIDQKGKLVKGRR
jgi:ribosomal-protein-alanine N-acetyltransferase